MNLLSIIKGISPKPTVKYGFVIVFSDIFNACKLHGHNDHHFLEFQMKELEKQGLLSIVYQDEYEDLIIGAKIID